MQKLQEQLDELLLWVNQERQERTTITSRLSVLESKHLGPPVTSIPISSTTSLPQLHHTLNHIPSTTSAPPQSTDPFPVHPLSNEQNHTYSHFPNTTPTPTQFHHTHTNFNTPLKWIYLVLMVTML